MNEYEHEPVKGLPERLPDGEQMIWQGEPSWRGMAQRVFHVRKVAIYFALIVAIYLTMGIAKGEALTSMLGTAAWQVALGGATIGILLTLARLYSRSTCYTITDRRLVMRFGVALPIMMNIPWEKIDSASSRSFADGSGDILLTLIPGEKISYWMIWPHARPWHFAPVQPLLRSLPDADVVAERLRTILKSADGTVAIHRGAQRESEPSSPDRARTAAAI
jgi:hypothetical protein